MQDDYQGLRRFTGAAVLIVAAIAATVSYLHIYRLAVQLGQPPLAAWLMPLSVDGTVGAASAALLWSARSGQRSPWTARTMLALGVLATLLANADFGSRHGAAGIILSAWPGIAFVGSAETAFGMVRRSASLAVAEVASADVVASATGPVELTAIAPIAVAVAPDRMAVTDRPPRTRKAAAPAASRSRRAAAILAKSPDISGAELGRKLGVSERTGRRLMAQTPCR